MFIQLNNLAKVKNEKATPKIAEVINNNDPKMLGRIKVRLIGMFEPEDEMGTNLPWIRKLDVGYGSDQAQSVPNVGDRVCIVWPFDSVHAFYKGIPCGSFNSGASSAFLDAGTEESGQQFGDLQFKMDKSINGMTLTNNQGCTVTFDGMGNMYIEVNNIFVTAKNMIDIDCPQVNINGALTTTEDVTSDGGTDGVITFMNVGSVMNGKVMGIE